MTVSEFVRGGIYNLSQDTIIMSHGTELGRWTPRGQTPTAYYASTPTSASDLSGLATTLTKLRMGGTTTATTRSFTGTPQPISKSNRRRLTT